MNSRSYFVHILASRKNGTLYVGVTNNIARRVYEHKKKLLPGFTSKYAVNRLVYFEEMANVNDAIIREKQIKGWVRKKKIESTNPDWDDLSATWFQ